MSTVRSVHGVGINNANYKVSPRVLGVHVTCPYYATWSGMFYRCYCEKHLLRQPTYLGCSVDPKWHFFMTFREWMITQEWEGKHLDKDLLVKGNKVYGPDRCIFVTPEVNSFISERRSTNSLPTGVSIHPTSGLYRARYRSFGGAGKTIGYFKNIPDAEAAYLVKKTEALNDLISGEKDQLVREALIRRYFNKQREITS